MERKITHCDSSTNTKNQDQIHGEENHFKGHAMIIHIQNYEVG